MSYNQRWRLCLRSTTFIFFFLTHNLTFGLCFTIEAMALIKFKERIERDPFGALMNWGEEIHHCSWSGVVCSHEGSVVILILQDLSLQGTLAPELGNLTHLKSLILRNNSFSGNIPKEVADLQELEILDLCDNNFRQSFSFARKLLQLDPPDMDPGFGPPPPPVLPPSTPPSPSGNNSVDVFFPPLPLFTPPQSSGESPPTDFQAEIPPAQLPPLPLPTPPSPTPVLPRAVKKKGSSSHKIIIIVGVIAGVLVLVAALGAFFLLRKKKVIMIKPWTARSSGLLQDEVVITGVPKLKLSELETACEDFSNIISSTSSDGTIYKGTLATGSEIAVLTVASGALQDWSSDHETQFQEKIHRLSQVDHKNFLNLIGYCHEDEPFNRMLVFEYAPYGSLSEHLHEQHTEQLDWPQRLRIAMGIAYCVEHMNNLNPKPISQNNLNSSSIYLTTDYAAKVSDFTFLRSTKPDPHISYVFSFGAILHEIITGKIQDPDSLTHESKPVRELLDPTLKSFNENVAERLWEVVLECLEQRIEMSEAVAKMRDITGITEEAALPRLSPAWWAELEIISTEGT